MAFLEFNKSDPDFYQLLEIEITANESEIRKAYRRKALSCHPDKNPDNPKAVELFHKLSAALEILTNRDEKAKYDRILKTKRATEVRHRQLNNRRQKLKEELEKRESKYSDFPHTSSTTFNNQSRGNRSNANGRDIIEELRRESARLLQFEQELQKGNWQRVLEKRLQEEKEAELALKRKLEQGQWRLKVKWKASKDDESENGGYSREILINYFKKYGDILAIVMNNKKGRAVVEYLKRDAAQMAVDYEKGNPNNPLEISWIKEEKKTNAGGQEASKPPEEDSFEALAMKRIRYLEKRKRLLDEELNAQKEEEEEEDELEGTGEETNTCE